jgi:hypothetical protein
MLGSKGCALSMIATAAPVSPVVSRLENLPRAVHRITTAAVPSGLLWSLLCISSRIVVGRPVGMRTRLQRLHPLLATTQYLVWSSMCAVQRTPVRWWCHTIRRFIPKTCSPLMPLYRLFLDGSRAVCRDQGGGTRLSGHRETAARLASNTTVATARAAAIANLAAAAGPRCPTR